MSIDITLFHLLNGLVGKSGLLDAIFIFLGEYLPYVVFIAALLLFFKENTWKKKVYDFYFMALAVLMSRGLVTTLIRIFYERPRPFAALPDAVALISKSASDPSFPSGHAAFFFALAIAIFYTHRNLFRYFLVAACLIAVARVFAGVHYPLDIIAGALVGWGSAVLAHRLLRSPNNEEYRTTSESQGI